MMDECRTCHSAATRWTRSEKYVTGSSAYCDRCFHKYWLFTPLISREEAEVIHDAWWNAIVIREVMEDD